MHKNTWEVPDPLGDKRGLAHLLLSGPTLAHKMWGQVMGHQPPQVVVSYNLSLAFGLSLHFCLLWKQTQTCVFFIPLM